MEINNVFDCDQRLEREREKNSQSMRSSSLPRSSDSLLLEDLDSTSPLDDGESLNGRSSSENGSFLLCGFEGEFLVERRNPVSSTSVSFFDGIGRE